MEMAGPLTCHHGAGPQQCPEGPRWTCPELGVMIGLQHACVVLSLLLSLSSTHSYISLWNLSVRGAPSGRQGELRRLGGSPLPGVLCAAYISK